MQVENIIVVAQFKKTIPQNPKQKPKQRLFIRLFPKKDGLHLLSSAVYEEETFKENTQKEIWKNFGTEDFYFVNGDFYDSYKNKLGERIIQCSNVCLLNKSTEMDENWYEVNIGDGQITLKNNEEEIRLEFRKDMNTYYIISANVLLSENHTQILMDAIFKLKSIFLFTDMFFHFIPSEFTIADATELFDAFCNKPFSKATFKRRFRNLIEEKETKDDVVIYTKSVQ